MPNAYVCTKTVQPGSLRENTWLSSCKNSMFDTCAVSCFISCIAFLLFVDHIIL